MAYKNFYDYKKTQYKKSYKFMIGRNGKGKEYAKRLRQLKTFRVKH